MVISSCEDIHQGIPLVKHIMHGFILLRLRQKAVVGCHAVKLLLYEMHDWYCVLLSPFVVVAFRPAVFSDLMFVVLVVKEVDKAYDNLGIEIVPTIEKLSLYMLEACQTQQSLCHFTVWGETV